MPGRQIEVSAHPISDPLRRAIAESGLSACGLSRKSGVHVTALVRFIRGQGNLSLASVDKLSQVLAFGMASDTDGAVQFVPGEFAEPLRRAIAESGLSCHEISRRAGLSPNDVRQFARRARGLMLTSADKLADVLGVKAIRLAGGRPDKPNTAGIAPANAITEALRLAIADSGKTIPCLAGDAGVHQQSLYRFVRLEGDLVLSSVDRLMSVLGLEASIRPNNTRHVRLSEALLLAIADSERSRRRLARESGVMSTAIGHFVRREGDMKLATAERLCEFLGIDAVRGGVARKPDQIASQSGPLHEIAGPLRRAIAESGLSFYKLAGLSGVSAPTISRFLSGKRSHLGYNSASKLAKSLGIDPERLADLRSKKCPVELRGEAFPALVYGREIPRLSGVAYSLLAFAVERFHQGGVCLGSELGAKTTSTSNRPIQSLTMKLKEPGFEPLARVVKWEGKKGGTLRIIDPGPES
jgi:transcriptional regulator with XRE-family HTH domain